MDTEKGHGLKNMEERAEEAGYKFIIQSIPGKGTTVTLTEKKENT